MEKYLANKSTNLLDALQKITTNGSKHLIVINNKEKVVGLLSDGDIRRAILKKNKLNTKIESIYNKKFFYFKEKNFSSKKAINKMIEKNIFFAPILNSFRKLIDIVIIGKEELKKYNLNFISKTKKFTVILMAGGLGTRLKPFTNILPKPLIPMGNKTVIEKIIDTYSEFGINKFIITLNYKSQIIKSFFREIKITQNINFYIEKKPLGTIGALGNLKNKLKENFILTNSDSIINIDFNDLINFHEQNKNDLTIVTALKKYQVPYGSCIINNKGYLKKIIEKPSYDLLVNTGLYVINSRVLNYIKKNKKMDVDEFIQILLKKRKKVRIYPISEINWQDAGNWEQYNKLDQN